MLDISEATGHLLDCLNLAVDTLTHGICYTVFQIGHGIGKVALDRSRCLPHPRHHPLRLEFVRMIFLDPHAGFLLPPTLKGCEPCELTAS